VLLADVALPLPLNRAFTYIVPDALVAQAVPGARVVCSFGARRLVGVVLGLREGQPPDGAKPIARAVDKLPTIPDDLLAFLRDLGSYYFAPIGEVVRLALPPMDRATASMLEDPTLFNQARGVAIRHVQWACAGPNSEPATTLRGRPAEILAHVRAVGQAPVVALERQWGTGARPAVRRLARLGLVFLEEREGSGDPLFAEPVARDAAHDATPAQAAAIDAIGVKVRDRGAATFLLHGVTSSGKTEVYLRAIAIARASARGAIMLVPEIALTPQLVARFRARFGDDVAVLHSGLTPRERHLMWRRLRSGEIDVAIGARSALFAPVRALGLVIVDEEHDASFKQEEGVRYHARDMAILRAHRIGAVCVLGSATPSLESEQLVRTGRATKLRLPDRARAQPMPRVDLVDLRHIGPSPSGDRRISLPLYRAIERTLQAGQQAILFLNRRGFAPSVRCESCGRPATCEQCSVAVTFHKRDGVVRCHYCDFTAPLAASCALCGAKALALEGLGTERLEEALVSAFRNARVARLDRDVASGKAADTILARMRSGDIDVLVGTQMVAKGHDLPNVTLVGVINADAALSIPDYRASERAFQLLVQVAGRAGRGDLGGQVIVQTWDPEHPAIAHAARHDVDGFIERELADRRELGYPPLTRAALVRVDSADEAEARNACTGLAGVALACEEVRAGRVLVQGPAPAPIARVRSRWRFRVMLRAAERTALRAVLSRVDEARSTLPRGVRASIDVDPVQLL
jgi:primosomal protein N' (replication factor Y)